MDVVGIPTGPAARLHLPIPLLVVLEKGAGKPGAVPVRAAVASGALAVVAPAAATVALVAGAAAAVLAARVGVVPLLPLPATTTTAAAIRRPASRPAAAFPGAAATAAPTTTTATTAAAAAAVVVALDAKVGLEPGREEGVEARHHLVHQLLPTLLEDALAEHVARDGRQGAVAASVGSGRVQAAATARGGGVIAVAVRLVRVVPGALVDQGRGGDCVTRALGLGLGGEGLLDAGG